MSFPHALNCASWIKNSIHVFDARVYSWAVGPDGNTREIDESRCDCHVKRIAELEAALDFVANRIDGILHPPITEYFTIGACGEARAAINAVLKAERNTK